MNSIPDNNNKLYQSLLEKGELLEKVIECLPHAIQIFSRDGTSVFINNAMMQMTGLRSIESHVGKYNVFKDPIVRKHGVTEQVRKVLTGETVYIADFSASYQDLINLIDSDIQSISADITCFPLTKDNNLVTLFAAIFILKKVYRGKEEIERGKRYIESYWQEPYSAERTAKAAYLSKAHFTKQFKKHTGITPHEYYINYKIDKLKEKLSDTNLSVSQAFDACSITYNGYLAKLFREKVGVSPSEYRKISK